MNNIKLLSVVILSSALLTGCSGNAKISRLSSDVQTLQVKIDQINNNVNALRSDIESAKEDAVRANQRLDNQATSYHK